MQGWTWHRTKRNVNNTKKMLKCFAFGSNKKKQQQRRHPKIQWSKNPKLMPLFKHKQSDQTKSRTVTNTWKLTGNNPTNAKLCESIGIG